MAKPLEYKSPTKGSSMWYEKLKKEWNDNPIAVIAVAALATNAVSKIIDAVSAAQGRRAYAQQVKYKTKRGK